MADYALQRTNMLESQVRPSDVTDRRVLRAMLDIAREQFVPAENRAMAYMDEAVRVADRRYLLAPRVLAKMLQLAAIADDGVVLDIGGATGYTTAVLARIARRVVLVEQDKYLAEAATAALSSLGVANAKVMTGEHRAGAANDGPFEAIIINGAIPEVPRQLLDQLKDGGRLVAVVCDGPAGKVMVHQRQGMSYDARPGFDAGAPPLPGFERKAAFVF